MFVSEYFGSGDAFDIVKKGVQYPEIFQLVSLFGDNGVFNWEEQGTYLDLYYGLEEDPLVGYPELEIVETGDFFNIAGPDPILPQPGPPPCYYGIDQNEEGFRSRYSGHVEVYIDDEDTLYMERSYGSYGVPGEYAQFRDIRYRYDRMDRLTAENRDGEEITACQYA